MVLSFFKRLVTIAIIMLPGLSFCQLRPELRFCGDTLRVDNLNQKLLAAVKENIASDAFVSEILGLYTKRAYEKGMSQPVAGVYSVAGTTLMFTPLLPLAPDEPYYARFSHNGVRLEVDSTIPSSPLPLTKIEAVYPATDTVPGNLLRMYIQFSAPMSTGEAYQHIRLLNDNGKVVDKPFLIIDQELWDEKRTRFTLLFDPGRIKTGVKSNLDLGLPLQSHKSYRLVIDAGWRDEHGQALAAGHEKHIVVKNADRTKLTTANWKITEPISGTKDPLIVRFNKPMDHFLALKYVRVTDGLMNVIPGKTLLKHGDTEWEFYPEKPWASRTYTLEIYPYLEDLAGNNFNNAFDVDLTVDSRISSSDPVTVSFVAHMLPEY